MLLYNMKRRWENELWKLRDKEEKIKEKIT